MYILALLIYAIEVVTNKVIAEICDGVAAMKIYCLVVLALIVSQSR